MKTGEQRLRYYPLTAPSVKPLIIRFWKNSINTTTGISAMFIPAVRYPQSILYSEMNWYKAT